jgi:hypothetical protein
LEFRQRIGELYVELFTKSENGDDDGSSDSDIFNNKWGWYNSINALADGNVLKFDSVTRLPLHKCLLKLSYDKDHQEVSGRIIKRHHKK